MPETVRAAVLYGFNQPLEVEEVELDPPKEGEVLVRIVASGVCHSDLHVVQGIHPTDLPVILGHEGAGIVETVGPDVRGLASGDHVLLTWLPYCGHCRHCVRGRPNRCENVAWYDATLEDGTCRFRKNGQRIHHYNTSSFAERSVVPARTAIPVDRDLLLRELALMGCAVMTGVGAVLNTAGVRPGDSVAVVGCGGVGLNAIQGARIAGATRIVAVDVVPAKLELARELGATDAVDASASDPVDAVRELVPGGVDHAFEALGRPATIETTLGLTGRGGQAVLIGMAPPDARVPLDALTVTLEERCVRGSWYGSCVPLRDFPLLVELYRDGRLRLDPLIVECGLEDVNDAFRRMEAGETARSVIVYE
ncbi:MAG: Zn-dependent alcohol dehydrogenase [Actinomycetota bacterium]|nr:Zn-dependent alcohol dehydrogenase [Actinomycetota bacterium]